MILAFYEYSIPQEKGHFRGGSRGRVAFMEGYYQL